jgi:hypothetical protein
MTPFENALSKITLSEPKRIVLTERYVNLLKHLKARSTRVSAIFHFSRTIVTVGSLIVPALLSIQYNQSASEIQFTIYWSTWVISLCVTTCNGLMTLFKIDKKYFSIFTVYEHLVSEGWQYIQLSGKYSGFYTPTLQPTHENQFIYFCNSVEKIRMRQIEEEYYKVTETPTTTPAKKEQAPIIDSLIPPTPFKLGADPQIQEFLNYISQKKADEGSKAPEGSKNSKDTQAAQTPPVSTTSYENGSSESLPV